MPITPVFAAIFVLIYVVLTFGVVRRRFGKKISLGTGEDRDLEKAIRIHGNFAEYVPLSLLLFWFVETITFNRTLVLVLASVLLVARICHVIGMKNPRSYLVLRQAGILATLGVMLVASLVLIWNYLPI